MAQAETEVFKLLEDDSSSSSSSNNSRRVVGSWDVATIEHTLALLQRISEIRRRYEACILMERLVHRLMQELAVGNVLMNQTHHVMVPVYESLIASWTRSGESKGLERAQEILEYMVTQLPKQNNNHKNHTMSTNDDDDDDNVQGGEEDDEEGTGCHPHRETFNLLLWAYARSGQPDGPAQAVRFLSIWYDWYQHGSCSFPPNTDSYAAVLFAHAQHDPWMSRLVPYRHHHHHTHDNVEEHGDQEPLAQSLSSSSSPFSAVTASTAPTTANEMLPFSSLDYHSPSSANATSHRNGFTPFTAATTSTPPKFDNPQVVLSLLTKMDVLSKQYPAVRPDVLCYYQYFVAIDVACRRREMSGREGAILAQAHLERMLRHDDPGVHPDSLSFHCVVRRWTYADVPDSVQRCEQLLCLQEDYHAAKGYSTETLPLISSYNTLIKCYSRSNLKDKVERACQLFRRLDDENNHHLPKPDSILYNSVMNVIARSGLVKAPEMLEEMLMEMEYKQRSGDPSIRINTWACNSFLLACSRSHRPDSFAKVESLVNKMRHMALEHGQREMAPNRYTYAAYLQSLAKAHRPDSIEKAEAILEEMQHMHERGFRDVKPDVYTYTNVLHCFANRGRYDSLERAVALLDHLEELHARGQDCMRPHRLTYSCCVNAIAKSTRPGKAKVALDILRRMQSVAVAPHIPTYNNVLNACAFSVHPKDDPEQVFDIAMTVFKEARQAVGANHITYLTMLRVINTQVRGREQKWFWVREMIQLCAQDGHLTEPIMHGARLNVSPMQFEELRLQVIDRRTGMYKQEFIKLDGKPKWYGHSKIVLE